MAVRWSFVLGGALLAVLTGPVAGAEIGGAPVRKAASANAAYYDWSGLYFGGHVGYSRGKAQTTLTDLDTAPDSFGTPFGSVAGGIQLGYNYILPSRIVLGIEADAAF